MSPSNESEGRNEFKVYSVSSLPMAMPGSPVASVYLVVTPFNHRRVVLYRRLYSFAVATSLHSVVGNFDENAVLRQVIHLTRCSSDSSNFSKYYSFYLVD